jgi:hypothetical protein
MAKLRINGENRFLPFTHFPFYPFIPVLFLFLPSNLLGAASIFVYTQTGKNRESNIEVDKKRCSSTSIYV